MTRVRSGRGTGGSAQAPHLAYDAVADASAALVIEAYSSSFGLASRLLGARVRPHVRNVYALVRVADEVVDAPRPGQPVGDRAAALDALERETLAAMDSGASTNLVVHAFARTARTCGIDAGLVRPFFASMRTDLELEQHDERSLRTYVYGSAEVVGLMCLNAFLIDDPDRARRYDALAPGAQRLGAAFQKVNFLRDLAEDHDQLGRTYFPGLDPASFSDAHRDQLLDDIDADLARAAAAIPQLPGGSRRAVAAAHGLYSALSRRLRATPAAEIRRSRVRVPDHEKAQILARVLLGRHA